MRFLVDIDVSGFLVDDPVSLGHDVVSVVDKDPKMQDANIPQVGEQQRIIVTTDQDVEGMIWRRENRIAGSCGWEIYQQVLEAAFNQDTVYHERELEHHPAGQERGG